MNGKKKAIHAFNLFLIDIISYLIAYGLTNLFFYLFGFENNLLSLAETKRLFNIGLPLAIIVIIYLIRGLYAMKPYLFWEELRLILFSGFVIVLLSFSLLFVFRVDNIKTFAVISLIIFIFINCFLRYIYRITITKVGFFCTNVIIIGTGYQGHKFQATVEENKFSTYRVLGYLDNHSSVINSTNVLGKIEDFHEIAKKMDIDEVVIAIPNITRKRMMQLMEQLECNVRTIRFIPDMYGVLTFSTEITDFDRVLTISASQGLLSASNRFYKRVVDVVLSSIALILLSPLFLCISILIRLEGKGPVIFSHSRLGQDGKLYRIYKFRTMIENAEEILKKLMQEDPEIHKEYWESRKLKNDPRITKVGKFLRKTSLDEFPQFLNVIKGDMSIVGPRPYLLDEIDNMGEPYSSIIRMKPGITGLWQTSGRSEIVFTDRVILDQYYVRNWSIWFDFVIMLKTFITVFSQKGAH